MDLKEIPIIVIGGPTAVGKTALSIKLAQQFNGEIINGDSLQVYRTLDIGTGKVTEDEKENIPHYLINILEPHEYFDASQFKELATKAIVDIYQRGKLPIIVGGTGLYLEGLLYNLEFGGQASRDSQVRQKYEQMAEEYTVEQFWQMLADKDPLAAQKIPMNNIRRIIRALEMMEITGMLFSDQESHKQQVPTFDSCILILDMPREVLYERINARVAQMIDLGLEQEVKAIYKRYNGALINGAKGIGYKEWWPFFENHIDHQQVLEAIQQNSRRYAKRQLTWFRNRLVDVNWIDARNALDEAQAIVERHLKKEEKV